MAQQRQAAGRDAYTLPPHLHLLASAVQRNVRRARVHSPCAGTVKVGTVWTPISPDCAHLCRKDRWSSQNPRRAPTLTTPFLLSPPLSKTDALHELGQSRGSGRGLCYESPAHGVAASWWSAESSEPQGARSWRGARGTNWVRLCPSEPLSLPSEGRALSACSPAHPSAPCS